MTYANLVYKWQQDLDQAELLYYEDRYGRKTEFKKVTPANINFEKAVDVMYPIVEAARKVVQFYVSDARLTPDCVAHLAMTIKQSDSIYRIRKEEDADGDS